jgi:hypothetical protein
MNFIKITTQQEFNNLPKFFKDFTEIQIYGNIEISTAWENSQVTARGNVSVHSYSSHQIILFGCSVCWLLNKSANAIKKSISSKIFKFITNSVSRWLNNQGIKTYKNKKVILFKRVSKDFKTQENTINETIWNLQKEIEVPNWNPQIKECGEGKFHACSYPYFCDEFRNNKDDKYIAIEISVKDLYAWPEPSYPYKIAFKKGIVLYECDKFGNEIKNEVLK